MNLLSNTNGEPSKFKEKNWVVKHDDDARGTQKVNCQIKLQTTILNSSLCDYTDVGILMKGTMTITEAGAVVTARNEDKTNKNFVSFTDYISKINKTQVDNAKSLDVLMLMYILIEYRNNYMKTSYI